MTKSRGRPVLTLIFLGPENEREHMLAIFSGHTLARAPARWR